MEDPRAAAQASGRLAYDEAEPGVHEEVDRAPQAEVHAAPPEAPEAELEAEEEKERHDPKLRNELRHLGRLDDREELRLIRAEQDAGDEIRRDG
jgi:hypothetical protein